MSDRAVSGTSIDDGSGQAGQRTVIGVFVLGGVALALTAAVLFGKAHLFSPTMRAAIVFQDTVSGLAVGAPVNFRGVRVGAVTSIAVEFDTKAQTAYIPVTIELEQNRVVLTGAAGQNAGLLPKAIAEGLKAQLNLQSFVTGQSEIDLEFDPESVPVLHPTITSLPEIPTRQSTIQKVKNELSQLPLRELAENTNATIQSLRTLSEKLDRTLPPLLESLRTTSDQTAAALTTASQAIVTLQGRPDTTLGDISRVANTGTSMLNARGAELRTVLAASNQTVVQARDILADLKGLTAQRGADRANVDSALRDLATAAASLRGLATDVEHNPQLLLTGRRP